MRRETLVGADMAVTGLSASGPAFATSFSNRSPKLAAIANLIEKPLGSGHWRLATEP